METGPVAQGIRARGYEPRCRGFESLLAQNHPSLNVPYLSLVNRQANSMIRIPGAKMQSQRKPWDLILHKGIALSSPDMTRLSRIDLFLLSGDLRRSNVKLSGPALKSIRLDSLIGKGGY